MDDEHPIDIVRADETDLHRTAALHVTELPHGLFPRLGVGFVRLWHRANLKSVHGVVLVARHADVVVGVLLGTTDRKANVAWILRHHRRELTGAALRAFVTRPYVFGLFLRTRGRRYLWRVFSRGPTPPTVLPENADGGVGAAAAGPVAVLDAIVVAPHARGRSVGTVLVDEYLAIVAEAGIDRAELVTKAGVEGAAGFYERGGWHRVGTHLDRDGDRVLTYRIDPLARRTR